MARYFFALCVALCLAVEIRTLICRWSTGMGPCLYNLLHGAIVVVELLWFCLAKCSSFGD